MTGMFGRLGRLALDLLLPPQCLSCGELVSEPGSLCATCWERIAFITSPLCACCGTPFALDGGPLALCGACLNRPPAFARARAVFVYDDPGKGLVLRFKHADRTDMAPTFARWMARAGAELVAEADVVAPVPLHWTRLFLRRFNQAALLANLIAADAGRRAAPDLLIRHRRTPPQVAMGRGERARNVRGAFTVRRPALVAGRRVLLIDDVLTTGATLSECSKALLRAGASDVDVLTLARVVRPTVVG